ncbi:MAG TPA: hypothetical protein VIJ36_01795 [Thermoanaerobaculia bacterium]
MSANLPPKDLVFLVPDKNIEASVKGLLHRPEALGIQPVTFDLFVHPERDPGCLLRGPDFLRQFLGQYYCALIVMDHEGCGREMEDRTFLEAYLEDLLERTGWDHAAAVVIAPELESWIWSDSPRVDRALGWERRPATLRDWLRAQGLLGAGATKPIRPKQAMELALWTVRKPRSSSIYLELAQSVSTDRCTDPAFLKLKRCLREWFPPSV